MCNCALGYSDYDVFQKTDMGGFTGIYASNACIRSTKVFRKKIVKAFFKDSKNLINFVYFFIFHLSAANTVLYPAQYYSLYHVHVRRNAQIIVKNCPCPVFHVHSAQ